MPRGDSDTFERLPGQRKAKRYKARAADQVTSRYAAVQHAKDAGCIKQAYATKADAERMVAHVNATPGPQWKALRGAYRCPLCRQFHVTSLKK